MNASIRNDSKASRALLRDALAQSFTKFAPRTLIRNPILFLVAVTTLLLTVAAVCNLRAPGESVAFTWQVIVWLWLTILFSNFAEALAEGRGRAQAESLKRARRDTTARRLISDTPDAGIEIVPSTALRTGDLVRVDTRETIPADGEVVRGCATVDESAITGESAPVIREAGGDRSAVTGGTIVLSDSLIVRVTQSASGGFLDRMIAMVEGAKRKKTPNEIALLILLVALTLVFLLVIVTLLPFSRYSVELAGRGEPISILTLIALLVCLIPTTIGGLLSAIGIAGMDRLIRRNVIATSGRAVEAAGDVDILLLDKTGTITIGNRQAVAFSPVHGVSERELAEAAQLASLADETPEGRSIVVLAKERFQLRADEVRAHAEQDGMRFIGFRAETRMSGVDLRGEAIRKGAIDAISKFVTSAGHSLPNDLKPLVDRIATAGGTPLAVCRGARVLGVVHLKDIVKGGIRERFKELRDAGIRTVMITGDNPLTAAAIAAEAGVDDFLAEAKPEQKLALIRSYQEKGHLVAMTGDGTNDAPALAQADVAVAMNTGTQAAREAANMVDLDSNPTKLLDIVQIGKQMLMTRGSLTTFSIANDVAKYFAILPAAFSSTWPELRAFDVMHLHSPASAILSAVVFNALIIVALVPLALRGVRYRARSAAVLLRENLLLYGLGGLLAPFVGIKAIDLVLASWV